MSGSPVQIAEGMLKILNPEKQSAADIVLQAAIDSFVSLPQDMWTLAKDCLIPRTVASMRGSAFVWAS